MTRLRIQSEHMSPRPVFCRHCDGILRKSLAAFLAALVAYQTIATPLCEASFWEARRAAVSAPTPESLEPTNLGLQAPISSYGINTNLPLAGLTIPSDLGSVVSTFYPEAVKPLIIHIQDAHEIVGAQQNAAEILSVIARSVATKQSLRDGEIATLPSVARNDRPAIIAVEGAWGPIDSDRLASFPNKDAKILVAESFLAQKKLFGEEARAIMDDPGAWKIVGVEDKDLYLANGAAKSKVEGARPQVLSYLGALRDITVKLGARLDSASLRAFKRKAREYSAGRLALTDYLKYLAQIPRTPLTFPNLKKTIELSEIEKTVRASWIQDERKALIERASKRLGEKNLKVLLERSLAFRLGKISPLAYHQLLLELAHGLDFPVPNLVNYVRYLKFYESIDVDKLPQELSRCEMNVGEALASRAESKTLFQLERWLSLQEKAWKLDLTPDEFTEYIRTPRPKTTHLGQALPPAPKELLTHSSHITDFYRLAEARNKALVENTLKLGRSMPHASCSMPIVLIAGGYHTPGMTHLFKEAAQPFMVIRPSLEPAKIHGPLLVKNGTLGSERGTFRAEPNLPAFNPKVLSAVAGILEGKTAYQYKTSRGDEVYEIEIDESKILYGVREKDGHLAIKIISKDDPALRRTRLGKLVNEGPNLPSYLNFDRKGAARAAAGIVSQPVKRIRESVGGTASFAYRVVNKSLFNTSAITAIGIALGIGLPIVTNGHLMWGLLPIIPIIPFMVQAFFIGTAFMGKQWGHGRLIAELKDFPQMEGRTFGRAIRARADGTIEINRVLMSRLPVRIQRWFALHELEHIQFAEHHPSLPRIFHEPFVALTDFRTFFSSGGRLAEVSRLGTEYALRRMLDGMVRAGGFRNLADLSNLDNLKTAVEKYSAQIGGLQPIVEGRSPAEVKPQPRVIPSNASRESKIDLLQSAKRAERFYMLSAGGKATRQNMRPIFDRLGIAGFTPAILKKLKELSLNNNDPIPLDIVETHFRPLIERAAVAVIEGPDDLSFIQRDLLQLWAQVEEMARGIPEAGVTPEEALKGISFVVTVNSTNREAIQRQLAALRFPGHIYVVEQPEVGGLTQPDNHGVSHWVETERYPEGHWDPFVQMAETEERAYLVGENGEEIPLNDTMYRHLLDRGVKHYLFGHSNDLHLLRDMASVERWEAGLAEMHESRAQVVMETVFNRIGQPVGAPILKRNSPFIVMRDPNAMKTPDLVPYQTAENGSRMNYVGQWEPLGKVRWDSAASYPKLRPGNAITRERLSGDGLSNALDARTMQQEGLEINTFKDRTRIPNALEAMEKQDGQSSFQSLLDRIVVPRLNPSTSGLRSSGSGGGMWRDPLKNPDYPRRAHRETPYSFVLTGIPVLVSAGFFGWFIAGFFWLLAPLIYSYIGHAYRFLKPYFFPAPGQSRSVDRTVFNSDVKELTRWKTLVAIVLTFAQTGMFSQYMDPALMAGLFGIGLVAIIPLTWRHEILNLRALHRISLIEHGQDLADFMQVSVTKVSELLYGYRDRPGKSGSQDLLPGLWRPVPRNLFDEKIKAVDTVVIFGSQDERTRAGAKKISDYWGAKNKYLNVASSESVEDAIRKTQLIKHDNVLLVAPPDQIERIWDSWLRTCKWGKYTLITVGAYPENLSELSEADLNKEVEKLIAIATKRLGPYMLKGKVLEGVPNEVKELHKLTEALKIALKAGQTPKRRLFIIGGVAGLIIGLVVTSQWAKFLRTLYDVVTGDSGREIVSNSADGLAQFGSFIPNDPAIIAVAAVILIIAAGILKAFPSGAPAPMGLTGPERQGLVNWLQGSLDRIQREHLDREDEEFRSSEDLKSKLFEFYSNLSESADEKINSSSDRFPDGLSQILMRISRKALEVNSEIYERRLGPARDLVLHPQSSEPNTLVPLLKEALRIVEEGRPPTQHHSSGPSMTRFGVLALLSLLIFAVVAVAAEKGGGVFQFSYLVPAVLFLSAIIVSVTAPSMASGMGVLLRGLFGRGKKHERPVPTTPKEMLDGISQDLSGTADEIDRIYQSIKPKNPATSLDEVRDKIILIANAVEDFLRACERPDGPRVDKSVVEMLLMFIEPMRQKAGEIESLGKGLRGGQTVSALERNLEDIRGYLRRTANNFRILAQAPIPQGPRPVNVTRGGRVVNVEGSSSASGEPIIVPGGQTIIVVPQGVNVYRHNSLQTEVHVIARGEEFYPNQFKPVEVDQDAWVMFVRPGEKPEPAMEGVTVIEVPEDGPHIKLSRKGLNPNRRVTIEHAFGLSKGPGLVLPRGAPEHRVITGTTLIGSEDMGKPGYDFEQEVRLSNTIMMVKVEPPQTPPGTEAPQNPFMEPEPTQSPAEGPQLKSVQFGRVPYPNQPPERPVDLPRPIIRGSGSIALPLVNEALEFAGTAAAQSPFNNLPRLSVLIPSIASLRGLVIASVSILASFTFLGVFGTGTSTVASAFAITAALFAGGLGLTVYAAQLNKVVVVITASLLLGLQTLGFPGVGSAAGRPPQTVGQTPPAVERDDRLGPITQERLNSSLTGSRPVAIQNILPKEMHNLPAPSGNSPIVTYVAFSNMADVSPGSVQVDLAWQIANIREFVQDVKKDESKSDNRHDRRLVILANGSHFVSQASVNEAQQEEPGSKPVVVEDMLGIGDQEKVPPELRLSPEDLNLARKYVFVADSYTNPEFFGAADPLTGARRIFAGALVEAIKVPVDNRVRDRFNLGTSLTFATQVAIVRPDVEQGAQLYVFTGKDGHLDPFAIQAHVIDVSPISMSDSNEGRPRTALFWVVGELAAEHSLSTADIDRMRSYLTAAGYGQLANTMFVELSKDGRSVFHTATPQIGNWTYQYMVTAQTGA